MFTKCPRDPQKWTIAPALNVAPVVVNTRGEWWGGGGGLHDTPAQITINVF